MMKLVLLFGLFLALAYAQDADCPYDPCSRDLPSDCTYSRCIHVGQCMRVFVNEDGEKVCLNDNFSTNNCSFALNNCVLYCPYGYETNEDTGCLKCECKARMPCTNVDCPALACEDPSRTIVPTGLCCPVCLPGCDQYQPCKVAECKPEEIDVSTELDCCPVCVPKTTCDTACPEPNCSEDERVVTVGCCPICVAKLDCKLIQCPALDCPEGILYSETSCCPKCAQPDPCANVESCPKLNCTNGEVAVRVDGECCQICRSPEYCERISCPEFTGDCPAAEDEAFMIQRDGTCCPYCPTCRDTERTRCDRNDRSVCAPGFFRGADCSEEVPANERLELRIEINVAGLALKESDIKTFIANKLEIDPAFITVTQNGGAFTVIISDDAANPSLDFNAIQTQADQVIAATSFLKKAETSGSVQLLISGALFASYVALLL